MKTIGKNAVFKALQNSDYEPYIIYTLQRREWDSGTNTYDWEAIEDVAIDLNDWIIKSTNPSMQLDSVFLNEFKASNVTLTVRGTTEWMYGGSHFTGNFIAMKSLVKIESGFKDSKGVKYGDKIYQGVIPADGIKINIEKNETQIQVVGLDYLFKTTDASRVALTRTDESIGTGDGSQVYFNFPVAYKGVGRIIDVEVNSVAKDESDYEINRMNDPDLAPQIKFNTAPANTHAITASYEYWYADKTIEYLVDALCTAAGITNTEIMDAIFPSYSEGTKTQNTDVHFDAGTFEKTERVDTGTDAYVKLTAGLAEDWVNMLAGDKPHNGWNKEYYLNPVSSSYSSYDGYIKMTDAGGGTMVLNMDGLINHALPTWENKPARVWKYFQSSLDNTGSEYINFKFSHEYPVDEAIKVFFNSDKRFYMIFRTGAARLDFVLDGSVAASISNAYLGYAVAQDNHTIRPDIFVKRVDANTVRVYPTGQEAAATAQGWNITTDVPLDYLEFVATEDYSSGGITYHPDLWIWHLSVIGDYIPQGDWQSATIDFGATPIALGKLISDIDLNTNITEIYTCTKAADAGWSDDWSTWTKLSANNNINSSPLRYIRVRVKLLTNVRYSSGSPQVNSLIIYYYTGAGITIEMADFKDEDCWQSIKRLAKLCRYEMGFENQDTDGETLPLFFFKRKDGDSIADIEITDDNYLLKIIDYDDGYRDIYNRVEVTFGNNDYVADSVTEGDGRPHSIDRYGVKKLNINLGDLLSDTLIDIATDCAETYYEARKNPLYKVRCLCSYLPALELSDVVLFTCSDLGITADYAKVVYISHDKNNWETTVTLREI